MFQQCASQYQELLVAREALGQFQRDHDVLRDELSLVKAERDLAEERLRVPPRTVRLDQRGS